MVFQDRWSLSSGLLRQVTVTRFQSVFESLHFILLLAKWIRFVSHLHLHCAYRVVKSVSVACVICVCLFPCFAYVTSGTLWRLKRRMRWWSTSLGAETFSLHFAFTVTLRFKTLYYWTVLFILGISDIYFIYYNSYIFNFEYPSILRPPSI